MADGMAADAISGTGSAEDMRPYAPGWLHALIVWLEQLPGSLWVAYAVIALVEMAVFHAIFWTTGRAAVGEIVPVNVFWGVATVSVLWTAAYLERLAARAVVDARPALRLSDEQILRLEAELAMAPANGSALVALVSVVLTTARYLIDPVAAGIGDTAAPLAIAAYGFEVLNVAVGSVIVFQLLRQVRLVRRTLRESAIVDLFRPGPLSAFSRITSRAGIAVSLIAISSLVVVPGATDPTRLLTDSAPFVILPTFFAVVAFVVPLYGFHERLVAEKERLEDEAEIRLKGLLADINHDIDTRDLARVDAMGKALSSMLAQRDVLAKLPTWPWSTGTFRGFLTAILLPLAIFLVQRLLLQFV